MEVITTIEELRRRLEKEPRVSCVPTMGNIHDGHLRLVGIAHDHAPLVVTTIFVNRLQFTGGEDFDRYPRTFEEDCEKLSAHGVHIVFHPDEKQMYPYPQTFVVEPPPIANKLEGRFRPGHFRGMATVVLKLFNMVQPLALPVQIVAAETRRAEDGLALSSRNRYLSEPERREAPRLHQVLNQVK